MLAYLGDESSNSVNLLLPDTLQNNFGCLFGCEPAAGIRLSSSQVSRTVMSRIDSKSRFAIFLGRILWKMRLASRENISASLAGLTSLARREKCDIL
jgi:hypothetical protein